MIGFTEILADPERCAGVDISEKGARVCVCIPDAERRGAFTTEATVWGVTANAVLALREHLLAAGVTLVVIETASDRWMSCFQVLAGDVDVILVDTRQAGNLPGGAADVPDAAWLARLGAYGLLHSSPVPPEAVCELRDLVRARVTMARDRDRVAQRLERLLEDAGQSGEHRAFLARLYLDQYDQLTTMIRQLDARAGEAMAPFRPASEAYRFLMPPA